MKMNKAVFWNTRDNGGVRCGLCPHRCHIAEGSAGICGVRENRGGELYASGYGQVSSVALDPIEKKPLYMFHPDKRVLSIGGFGCNLRCPFCQNYEISMVYGGEYGGDSEFGIRNSELTRIGSEAEKRELFNISRHSSAGSFTFWEPQRPARYMSPVDVAALAVQTVPDGNIGVAYTYNEPLIGYEFLYGCAGLVREAGLYNVIVTNGYINKEPLENLLPVIDAMNIDLKGFKDSFYKRVGGSLEAVKETIELSRMKCHVEVTTLIIPDENEDDIEGLSKWLSSIDPDIPLHLSRFFPRYRYTDRAPTPRETIKKSCEIAKRHLRNVFAGNMG